MGFLKFDTTILQFKFGSIEEKFYIYLMRKENKERFEADHIIGQVKLTRRTIAKDLEISENIARRLLKQFQELGILIPYKLSPKTSKKPSVYMLKIYTKNHQDDNQDDNQDDTKINGLISTVSEIEPPRNHQDNNQDDNPSIIDNIINNKNESVLDLGSLVQKNIEPYKLIAKSKKINIKMNLKESFNIKVDEKLFTKAISNIISNAVNYTDEGKEIRIYIKDKKLIIENDCKPISEEHLAHIFEAFYRVDFDRNKSSGGNGLGLYIVQQILKMYNLDYSFKSILTGMSFEVDFN